MLFNQWGQLRLWDSAKLLESIFCILLQEAFSLQKVGDMLYEMVVTVDFQRSGEPGKMSVCPNYINPCVKQLVV